MSKEQLIAELVNKWQQDPEISCGGHLIIEFTLGLAALYEAGKEDEKIRRGQFIKNTDIYQKGVSDTLKRVQEETP